TVENTPSASAESPSAGRRLRLAEGIGPPFPDKPLPAPTPATRLNYNERRAAVPRPRAAARDQAPTLEDEPARLYTDEVDNRPLRGHQEDWHGPGAAAARLGMDPAGARPDRPAFHRRRALAAGHGAGRARACARSSAAGRRSEHRAASGPRGAS